MAVMQYKRVPLTLKTQLNQRKRAKVQRRQDFQLQGAILRWMSHLHLCTRLFLANSLSLARQ